MRTATKNSNAVVRHLEDDDLISYLDGELLPEEQERARLHLESCWSCRTRLTTKQTSIENFVRLRQDVLLPRQLPPSGPTLTKRGLAQPHAPSRANNTTARTLRTTDMANSFSQTGTGFCEAQDGGWYIRRTRWHVKSELPLAVLQSYYQRHKRRR